MFDNPPVIPGVTQTDRGSEANQLLYGLAMEAKRSPSKLIKMLRDVARLYTPVENPEPETREPQPNDGQVPLPPPSPPPLAME